MNHRAHFLAAAAVLSALVWLGAQPGAVATPPAPSWVWWQATPPVAPAVAGVHLAADPSLSFLHTAGFNQYLTSSGDAGQSWISHYYFGVWTDIACSEDGLTVLAAEMGVGVFLSTDGGNLFDVVPIGDGQGTWTHVACSGDGTTLFAGKSAGEVYRSVDGGTSWTVMAGLPDADHAAWISFACSYDGRSVIAADLAHHAVYFSADQGATWAKTLELPATPPATDIFCAANGYLRRDASGEIKDRPSFAVVSSPGTLYLASDVDTAAVAWKTVDGVGDKEWKSVDMVQDYGRVVVGITDEQLWRVTPAADTPEARVKSLPLPANAGRLTGVRVSAYGDLLLLATMTGLYTTADAGANWTCLPSGGFWRAAAMTGAGTGLFVGGSQEPVCGSTDGGATWGQLSPDGAWSRVACSRDGATLLAASLEDHFLYLSTNRGQDWIKQTGAGAQTWNGLACADHGALLIACGISEGGDQDGVVKVSRDGGATWDTVLDPGPWRVAACSADAAVAVVLHDGGDASLSYDQGRSWRDVVPADEPKKWYAAACSADGSHLYLAAHQDALFGSRDGGRQWAQLGVTPEITDAHAWCGIACSADGQTVVAAALGAPLFLSHDAGTHWTPLGAADGQRSMWTGVAVSDRGDKILATMYAGNPWVGRRRDRLATLTTAVLPVTAGTVNPAGVSLVEMNTPVSLTATPALPGGYVFAGWTDSGFCAIADSGTLVCTGDAAATAVFSLDHAISPGRLAGSGVASPAQNQLAVSVRDAELPASPAAGPPVDRNGIAVTFGGTTFPCNSGSWKNARPGIWTYKSWRGAVPAVSLTLDYQRHTWTFSAARADVRAGGWGRRIPVALRLDADTTYATVVTPAYATTWRYTAPRTLATPFAVGTFSGSSRTGSGRDTLNLTRGVFPALTADFGEVSLSLNGWQLTLPASQFVVADTRRTFAGATAAGEVNLSFDLAKRTWEFHLRRGDATLVRQGQPGVLAVALQLGTNPRQTTTLAVTQRTVLAAP